MINKMIKTICITCTIICTCFTLCVNVKAETSTYTVISGCTQTAHTNIAGVAMKYRVANISNSTSEVRAIGIKTSSNDCNLWLVSQNSFRYYIGNSSDGACPVPSTNSSLSLDYYFGSNVYTSDFDVNNNGWERYVPVVDLINYGFSQTENSKRTAIYYTFGDGAVEPIEPTNWGQLRNVNYSTKIAGTGQASMANEDTISWAIDIDSFGNELNEECQVEIRAVKGSWSASLKEDLLKMVGDTFNISQTVAPTLATVPASQGSFSIEWDEVCNALDITTYLSLLAFLDTNNVYQKEGWIYEVRLKNQSDNYVGTWQRVYTATSGTAQGSETVINSNNFDINVNQMLQQISILNNQETTTININDVDYYTQNPNTGVEPEGGTNLWDILKALLEGIFQLLAKLGDIAGAIVNLVSDLLNGLLEFVHDLIIPVDGLPDISDELNDNINNYIEIEQPELHALQVKINDTAAELRSLASGQAGNCVISWPAVTMNLGLFQAGTVTLIQAGSVDFADMFNDLLDGAGITYNTYTFCVNGVIYCMLLAYINRHIISFLRKA